MITFRPEEPPGPERADTGIGPDGSSVVSTVLDDPVVRVVARASETQMVSASLLNPYTALPPHRVAAPVRGAVSARGQASSANEMALENDSRCQDRESYRCGSCSLQEAKGPS